MSSAGKVKAYSLYRHDGVGDGNHPQSSKHKEALSPKTITDPRPVQTLLYLDLNSPLCDSSPCRLRHQQDRTG